MLLLCPLVLDTPLADILDGASGWLDVSELLHCPGMSLWALFFVIPECAIFRVFLKIFCNDVFGQDINELDLAIFFLVYQRLMVVASPSLILDYFVDVCDSPDLWSVVLHRLRVAVLHRFVGIRCLLDLQFPDLLSDFGDVAEVLIERRFHSTDVLLVFWSLGESLYDLLQYSCLCLQFCNAVFELLFAILCALV